MAERISASTLLREAAVIFDAPEHQLARSANGAWKRGFASGGEWMGKAMGIIRGQRPACHVPFSKLGCVKYGAAATTALIVAATAVAAKQPWLLLAVIPAFYLVEAQMVFLFPLALDGCGPVISESRRWTIRAGGTWKVMRTVLVIAAHMLLGGFVGRGFVRSWCLGCLAIVLWYERLKQNPDAARSRLEIGASHPLLTRHARLNLFGNTEPVRLFYASDLHCNGNISRRAADQLVEAAKTSAPDLILLGGDLADNKRGLTLLADTVKSLRQCAPVWAIAGNHDKWTGLSNVRAAIEQGGGNWLDGVSALQELPGRKSFHLDGAIPPGLSTGSGRILCAHDPAIFPRAAALGYPLVLAGHLHGGQFVFGENRGRLLPAAWFYRWNGIRFESGQSTLLVSRGVADTLPLRWNCPREIILCELH